MSLTNPGVSQQQARCPGGRAGAWPPLLARLLGALLGLLVVGAACSSQDGNPPPFPSGPELPGGLRLDAVSPRVGPSSGGIAVTLSGSGFDFTRGTTVSFGGEAASSIQVMSATQLTAVLPPRTGSWRQVEVRVSTVGAGSVTRSDVFSYYLEQVSFLRRQYAGARPAALIARDVNGDGRSDVITANAGSNDVSVLLGNGDGTFGFPSRFAVGSGPLSLAVQDLNGDGSPDVVTANETSNNLSVLLNNKKGGFQPPSSITIGKKPKAVAIQDLNGDGKQDLVVAFGDSVTPPPNVMVILGNGNGTFRPGVVFSVGSAPEYLVIQDVTGDGKADLITGNYSDSSVLVGEGDGYFGPVIRTPALSNGPHPIAVQDLNGDGKPDLVTANRYDGNTDVLLGRGDGTFAPSSRILSNGAISAVEIRDVNGDGRADVVAVSSSRFAVSVVLGNGDGSFGAPSTFAAGFAPGPLAIQDVNGDGAPDLITASTSGVLSVLLGSGGGAFQLVPDLSTAAPTGGVATADLNGDHKLDLIASNYVGPDRSVSVFLGNGDGSFRSGMRFPTAADLGTPCCVAIQDLNADGKLDLVTVDNDREVERYGSLSVLLGNGDGTFQLPTLLMAGTQARGVAIRDLNFDGKPDLVSVSYFFNLITNGNKVSVLLGNGDGTFQPAVHYPGGTGPVAMDVEDVDGDGAFDVVTADRSVNSVNVLLGQRDGSFRMPLKFATGQRPEAVVIRDLNADGRPDVVTANYYDTVSVLLGRGDGTFLRATHLGLPMGSVPSSVLVSDA